MYSRLLKPPDTSFFLLGPRGTGKSSWITRQFPHGLLIDLLAAETFNDLLACPGRLETWIPAGFDDWILIDEIQKIPALLDEVHRLIERQHRRFVLTGSSARKLKRGNVNLLAGRALTLSMYPLTAAELKADFNLAHSLRYGHLPAVHGHRDPAAFLEAYVRTYLQEEVQQEGLTRNLGAFSRFLEAASFSQGSPLNVSDVARECAVERKTVENYFQILEDILLAFRLPVFTRRAKRRMTAHEKFYFFDAGVYRTLRPRGPLDRPEEIDGPALETLVLQELRALNAYLRLGYELYFWRAADQAEVDVVLYGERGIRAFEITRTRRIRRADTAGLLRFSADYPQARLHLIYGGERRMKDGGIDIIPVEYFFRNAGHFLQ